MTESSWYHNKATYKYRLYEKVELTKILVLTLDFVILHLTNLLIL